MPLSRVLILKVPDAALPPKRQALILMRAWYYVWPSIGGQRPYAAGPDRRVAEAKGWLERLFSSGEEVWGMSRLEREEEFAGNPHFSAGLISQEVVERLAKAGIPVDPTA